MKKFTFPINRMLFLNMVPNRAYVIPLLDRNEYGNTYSRYWFVGRQTANCQIILNRIALFSTQLTWGGRPAHFT